MSGAAPDAPSVLLIARAPRPGACKRQLEPVLGPDGCARLQATLIARAGAWARAVAPGRLHVACAPADGADEVSAAVGPAASVFAQEGEHAGQRLSRAVGRAPEAGPLLVVLPDVPGLSPTHAQAALEDLAAGCDVSVGPAMGGGFYLLGLRAPRPALLAAAGAAPGAEATAGGLLAAVGASGLSVGLLPSERDLHTLEDARSLLADPLAPADVRAALAAAA